MGEGAASAFLGSTLTPRGPSWPGGGGHPSTFLPGGGPRQWLRAEMEAALAGPGVARAVQRRTPSPVSVTPARSGSVIYVPREVPGWDLRKFREAVALTAWPVAQLLQEPD